ncbi:MAG TPA: Ig-like domain-containing protein [Candidatus Binatia bacterium]
MPTLLTLVAAPSAFAQTLTGLSLTPANAITMQQGQVVQFVATAHYSNGATADVTRDAQWTSGSTGVAIVQNPFNPQLLHLKGHVTAVAPGKTNITAQYGGLTARTQVTVTDTDIVAIITKPTSKNLEVGIPTQFKATAIFLDDSEDDVTKEVQWFSSDPSVATVSNTPPTQGLVTPLKPGTVVITARDPKSGVQNADGQANVRAQATHLAFDPPHLVIGKGIKYPIRVYVHRADGTRNQVTSDVEISAVPAGIVRINKANKLVGRKNGMATLSAYDPKRNLWTTASGNDATVEVRGKLKELHVDPVRLTVGEQKNARVWALLNSGMKSSDLRRIVQWSVLDQTIAGVGNSANDIGTVVGKKSGVTTLRAFYKTFASSEVDNLQVLGNLQSVALEIGDGRFPIGEEIEVKARGTYENDIKLNITDKCEWSVVNPNMAEVDNQPSSVDGDGKGWVKGKALGQTVLRATCEGKTAQAQIQVIGTMTGLVVQPAMTEMEALEEKQFKAIGQYSDGETKDLTKLVSWTSSNPGVATVDDVDDRGTVFALTTGSTNIVARKGNFVATGTVVVNAGIVRIEVLPDGNTIRGSTKLKMRANGIRANNKNPAPLTKRVVWSSANPEIARVSNRKGEEGTVFGGGVEGTTTITATLPGTDFTASAKVTTSCLLDSMEFGQTSKSWRMGRAKRAKMIGIYMCPNRSTRNITQNVEYTSSNPSVAVVSNEPKAVGLITPVSPGTTVITAVDPSTGKSATNSLLVTILP